MDRILETLKDQRPMSAESVSAKIFVCVRMTRTYLRELEARGMALVVAAPKGEEYRATYWVLAAQAAAI